MNRLIIATTMLAFVPDVSRGDEKATVRVTGTVTLPKGEKLPADAKVSVKIYFYQPSGTITWYSAIGTQEFTHQDPTKPINFSVAVRQSYPEKYAADRFLMRATISAPDGKRMKTTYASSDDDAVMPFDSNGKPKTNVKLKVSKN